MATNKWSMIAFVLTAALMATFMSAQSIEPIWLSPRLIGNSVGEFNELGVWTNISIGAGSRFGMPIVVMDSKKTLWLLFGYRPDNIIEFNVWNYDPQTDLYRWVTGPGNSTTDPRNPGELRVPSPNNHPGIVINYGSIDHNDNIWFMAYQYFGELWMFNTSSHYFTRMKGTYPQAFAAVFGTLGQPSDDVTPGYNNAGCLLVDSFNNLWHIGGQTSDGIRNRVWHFNTTSYQWTFFGGNTTQVETRYDNDPLYGSRAYQGCDMDENDRVWLFGGRNVDYYNDVWSYDTRTLQWQLEFGSNASIQASATVKVKDEFDAGNHPAAPDYISLFVDRKDGTFLLVSSQGVATNVWLFHKTLKQWKLIYGDPFNPISSGNFSHYRTPGSVMPGYLRSFGMANGLNIDGDAFIYGGIGFTATASAITYNSLWLIPQDQCTNSSNKCSSNARCIEQDVGYSCECNDGFAGDGFNCEVPVPNNPSSPSNEPIQSPASTTPLLSSQPSSTPHRDTQVSHGVMIKSSLSTILSLVAFTVGVLSHCHDS